MVVAQLVATTYRKKGGRKLYAHHVVQDREGELAKVVKEFCAQHLVIDCANCGRTPVQHDEDARVEEHNGRNLDCAAHMPHKPCGCGLDRWDGQL